MHPLHFPAHGPKYPNRLCLCESNKVLRVRWERQVQVCDLLAHPIYQIILSFTEAVPLSFTPKFEGGCMFTSNSLDLNVETCGRVPRKITNVKMVSVTDFASLGHRRKGDASWSCQQFKSRSQICNGLRSYTGIGRDHFHHQSMPGCRLLLLSTRKHIRTVSTTRLSS